MVPTGHIGQAIPNLTMETKRSAPVDCRGGDETMTTRTTDAEPLLTPAEVATMFRVDPKTVTRWAKAGKLTSIRTLGGHRRYRESEVRSLLAGVPAQRTD
jgi:excisionase family DNA binding protein